MIIKVEQKHIENGVPQCDWQCPVAQAIFEPDKFWNVSVGSEEIILNETSYAAPELVKNFVLNFDSGLPVAPFEFVIAD